MSSVTSMYLCRAVGSPVGILSWPCRFGCPYGLYRSPGRTKLLASRTVEVDLACTSLIERLHGAPPPSSLHLRNHCWHRFHSHSFLVMGCRLWGREGSRGSRNSTQSCCCSILWFHPVQGPFPFPILLFPGKYLRYPFQGRYFRSAFQSLCFRFPFRLQIRSLFLRARQHPVPRAWNRRSDSLVLYWLQMNCQQARSFPLWPRQLSKYV